MIVNQKESKNCNYLFGIKEAPEKAQTGNIGSKQSKSKGVEQKKQTSPRVSKMQQFHSSLKDFKVCLEKYQEF